ncbi:hypothetical protein B0H14DRAFT_2783365, partial [Mycena olivaceomarginata]
MCYSIHTLRLSAPLRLQLQLGPLHRMDGRGTCGAASSQRALPSSACPIASTQPPAQSPTLNGCVRAYTASAVSPSPPSSLFLSCLMLRRPSFASALSCSVSLRRLLATSPSSPTLRFASRPASIVHLSFPLHPAVSSQSPARETIRARCDSPGTGRGRGHMVAPMWCDEHGADAGCVHCRCRDAQAMAMGRDVGWRHFRVWLVDPAFGGRDPSRSGRAGVGVQCSARASRLWGAGVLESRRVAGRAATARERLRKGGSWEYVGRGESVGGPMGSGGVRRGRCCCARCHSISRARAGVDVLEGSETKKRRREDVDARGGERTRRDRESTDARCWKEVEMELAFGRAVQVVRRRYV